jgi:hypothetical protein
MAQRIGGNGGAGTGAAGGATTPRAADQLQNGRFTLDVENSEIGKAYGPMLAQLGETSGMAVKKKVEDKMTAWAQAHPGADKAAFDAELRKTLQIDTMQYKMVQDSINKMMKEIEGKMKEIANDRFG